MRTTAWIASLLVASSASAAGTNAFLPRPLAPEVGVAVLNRAAAERWTGRALLDEPAASAVYGNIHLYGVFPYLEARYVTVTSDAHWQRLLYGVSGDVPRAFGSGGSGPGQFREPRGLAFAPDGRLFVADRVLGRVTVLQLRDTPQGPELAYAGQIDGLVQPMDVAVHDGGTPADAADDRLLVAEAGAQCVALYELTGAAPVRLAEFGRRGSAAGEFLFPRAVCAGRTGGVSDGRVYVSDAGNHRLVQLELAGNAFEWRGTTNLPTEATSVDSDHHGNLYLALRRDGAVWKMSPRMEHVATYAGDALALDAPRDVAIPFAWVHDHRGRGTAGPVWRGQGSALVVEAWGASTGVRGFDLGVDIADVERRDGTTLEVLLTDTATLRATVVGKNGAVSACDLGTVAAGRQRVRVPALEAAARVTLVAESQYDPARRAERTLDLAALVPARLVLHQNSPNPFNPTTTIAFELPAPSAVRLAVYDVRGRWVRTLLEGRLDAGSQQAVWDGRDARGVRAGSGLYFYKLDAGGASDVRKMVLAQ